jgi:hypothetical protein
MWTTKGHDGFEFKECNRTKKGYCGGLPQEGMLKSTARKRGYIVIAVQGGASSGRGCFHVEDVPKIKQAINHVYTVEKLGELPMITTGMSAGGRTLGDLASATGGPGVPMKCAAVMVAEIKDKTIWRFPKTVPLGFWYMPKDKPTEKLIKKNMENAKTRKQIAQAFEIHAEPIDEKFLMADGHGFSEATAKKALKAFNDAGLLNAKGNLIQDPYNPKPETRWMKAINKVPGLKDAIGGFSQQAPMTKLMERSWASHALAGDRANEIIDFCEKTH